MESNSLSQHIRVAVIGLGQLSRQVHLPLLASMPGVRITALCDPDPAAREAARVSSGGVDTYTSLAELLRSKCADAVLIASPTADHAAQAHQVLDAGLALYLEKPIAADWGTGRILFDAHGSVRSHRLALGFNYRFHPLAARLRREIQAWNQVSEIESTFTIAPRSLPEWKHSRATGGGVLLDLASHHFDQMRYLLGAEPSQIEARLWSEQTEDDCAQVTIQFNNGAMARGLYSFCRSEQDRIEVTGRLGTASQRVALDRYAPLSFPFWPPAEFLAYQLERRRSPWKEVSFHRSLEAWLTGIRAGSRPAQAIGATLADGLASLQLVAAAQRSAKLGQAVILPLEESHS